MFKSVLIANRGEIAVRVIAACQEMHVRAVAVYSDADRTALHVRRADQAQRIGPAPASQSYLNVAAIIEAARAAGVDAIHPGYGFLSENADFAQACADAGIVFIGPPPAAIRLMGSKIAAKRAVEAVGVPTVPGYTGDSRDPHALMREARRIGFPIMIKAAAGGGGKGMRVVTDPDAFGEALESARREAQAAFGDDSVFLEKLVSAPRHVEFQILADKFGKVVHLGERECSIQRRHQKVIEESPCAVLTSGLRAEMGAAAVAAARAASYVNAGTCEFLLDANNQYYFLEMNTRLQVEHPVTESVAGLDLVHHQLRIAAGEPLRLNQEHIAARGHAIEARLYAEDPTNQYLPSTGTIRCFAPPVAPGIRVDAGVETGDDVSMFYDPMLAKLIVHAEDRPTAVARLRWALDRFAVLGVTTNLPLLRAIAFDPEFAAAHTNTDFLAEQDLARYSTPEAVPPEVLAAAAMFEVLATSAPNSRSPNHNPWLSGHSTQYGGQHQFRYLWKAAAHRVSLATVAGQRTIFAVCVDDVPYPSGTMSVSGMLSSEAELVLDLSGMTEHFHVVRDANRVLVAWSGQMYALAKPQAPDVDRAVRSSATMPGSQHLVAPMTGTIIKVNVSAGQRVTAHQTLVVVGAMKMEHAIAAPYAGRVRKVAHQVGEVVDGGATLIELEASADGH